MFTDDAVTPVRLEILLDVLRISRHGIGRDEVYRVLQPRPLSGEAGAFVPAKATIRAAIELELVEESGGILSLSSDCRKIKNPRTAILAAFDDRVLETTDVEDYFALFYSYYLGLGKGAHDRSFQSKETWADQFNKDVFGGVVQANRFNATKLTGLHRWLAYVGLGWYDPAGGFQANPYDRLRRVMPSMFGRQRKMDADTFMKRLAETCPELDGGCIFVKANRDWRASDKKCSIGLSHSLVELHLDGIVRLNCPADSVGWSVDDAEPPRGQDFKSDRIAVVELGTGG